MENKVDIRLKQFIENIERSEEEKKEITKQISDIYKEAKTAGFDTAIMKKIVALRRMDNAELQEQEYLLETYKEALGMNV
jgi:uncharacterized protein (UPF0335 family)